MRASLRLPSATAPGSDAAWIAATAVLDTTCRRTLGRFCLSHEAQCSSGAKCV